MFLFSCWCSLLECEVESFSTRGERQQLEDKTFPTRENDMIMSPLPGLDIGELGYGNYKRNSAIVLGKLESK